MTSGRMQTRGALVRGRARRVLPVAPMGALAIVATVLSGCGPATAHGAEPTSTSTAGSTPSPTAPPAPATATSSAPPAAPTRADDVDDATVVARLAAPRTGEVWTTPTLDESARSVLGYDDDPYAQPYLVGTRGDAKIYAVVNDPLGSEFQTGVVVALEEVDAAGARQIGCPSARASDPCVPSAKLPGVTYDTTTFYDSMTLPTSIRLGDGWTVTTAATRAVTRTDSGTGTGGYGALWYLDVDDPDVAGSTEVAESLPGDWAPARTEVAALGPLRVLSIEVSQAGAAHQDRAYAVQAPNGALYELARNDVPGGDYDAITWDDGTTRAADTTESGEGVTSGGVFTEGWGFSAGTQFSPAPDVDTAQWVRAGKTPTGEAVYVPTSGNPLVHQIRTAQQDASASWSKALKTNVYGAASGYPFTTDKAFRDAHALYAIAGPDGVWQLRLRADALSLVVDP